MKENVSPPFSLRIFVADGDPDGLRLVERSNWIGKCVVFPRAIFTTIRGRSEFQQTGVYILLGDDKRIYIGEGDPVRPRLEQHFAKKDFWTRAVFFVAGPGQLNKAHVQYLEAELVDRARTAKRGPLENGNVPAKPTLSEADEADMDVFLENMLGILPVLGVDAFEKAASAVQALSSSTFYCQGRGVQANGRESTQGFIVAAGSQASKDNTPSLIQHFAWICRLKDELVANGVLVATDDAYTFTQDYVFSSPSTAGAVVLGRASNGRVDWKDQTGRTLKEIQEAEADTLALATEAEPMATAMPPDDEMDHRLPNSAQ
jgi:hypothetical protein